MRCSYRKETRNVVLGTCLSEMGKIHFSQEFFFNGDVKGRSRESNDRCQRTHAMLREPKKSELRKEFAYGARDYSSEGIADYGLLCLDLDVTGFRVPLDIGPQSFTEEANRHDRPAAAQEGGDIQFYF